MRTQYQYKFRRCEHKQIVTETFEAMGASYVVGVCAICNIIRRGAFLKNSDEGQKLLGFQRRAAA